MRSDGVGLGFRVSGFGLRLLTLLQPCQPSSGLEAV